MHGNHKVQGLGSKKDDAACGAQWATSGWMLCNMIPYLSMPGCMVVMTVWRSQKVPQKCGALILVTGPLDAKVPKGSRGRWDGVKNLMMQWFWL